MAENCCARVSTVLEQAQSGRVHQEKCVMKFAAVSIVIAAALAGVTPAHAQAVNDVRCLMASNLYAKASKDPKQKLAAEATRLYYVGRIHGRLNATQLKAQLIAQQKTINPKNAGEVMNSCARQMEAGMKLVQTTSQQLITKK